MNNTNQTITKATRGFLPCVLAILLGLCALAIGMGVAPTAANAETRASFPSYSYLSGADVVAAKDDASWACGFGYYESETAFELLPIAQLHLI